MNINLAYIDNDDNSGFMIIKSYINIVIILIKN